ncbi:MAG: ABC transporter ATP-binding protein [Rhizobiaceae bacterium]|nr:ABC transporter ATP-binding protein [Rhizobiaceae bacterium]
MLELRDLSLNYGSIPAVRGLTVRVGPGEVVALIGANGAGKTSTLKAVLGLENAKGSVVLDGVALDKLPTPARVLAGISLSPEGRHVFPQMSVEENLLLGLTARTRPQAGSLTQEMYALFPRLYERASQKAGSLSGGEQQMLAIARALMSSPKLLMLDEPTLGLAPIIVSQLRVIIGTLKARGTSVLLAEQNAEMALACTDRAYVLENGKVAKEGLSRELSQDPAVRAAYLGLGEGDEE